MDFSKALHSLKSGYRVAREGWNGKGMYAYFIEDNFSAIPPGKRYDPDEKNTVRHAFGLLAADGSFGPWVPSTSDLLADDWTCVE